MTGKRAVRLKFFLRRSSERMLDVLIRGLPESFFTPRDIKPGTFAELELSIAGVPSLEAFLNSPAAQEKYCATLRKFIRRKRFTRAAYDLIITQLRVLHEREPRIGQTLWHRPSAREFAIDNPIAASGRNFNETLWWIYRARWMARLAEACQITPDQSNYAKREQAIMGRSYDYIARSIESFERSIIHGGLSASKIRVQRAAFYKSLRENPELVMLANFLLFRYLARDTFAYFTSLDTADHVIAFIRDLHVDPDRILQDDSELERLRVIPGMIRELIPRAKDLLADEAMFPIQPGASNDRQNLRTINGESLSTREIRPFHGLWTGSVHNDCLGGHPEHLEQTTPRRWAIGAIIGARTFFILQQGRYIGTVKIVPIAFQGHTIYSLDLLSPVLSTRLSSAGERQNRSRILFDIWIQHLLEHLGPDHAPLVMSDSKQSDLSQIKSAIFAGARGRASFQIQPERFGPVAEAVMKHEVPQGALKYGSSLITDALMSDAHAFVHFIHESAPQPSWISVLRASA